MIHSEKSITLQIINPHPWACTGLISAVVDIPPWLSSLQLYTENNEEITSQISPLDEGRMQFSFVAEDVPPQGTQAYIIKPRDRTAEMHLPAEGLLDGNDFYLENDTLRAVFEEDGSLTIMHRVENPESEEECSEETEQKIYAMGEELTEGSIWAGDVFTNFRPLHVLSGSSTGKFSPVGPSKLLEANDFWGKVCLNSMDPANPGSILSTIIAVEKGESQIVKINCVFGKNRRLAAEYLTPLSWERQN